LKNLSGDRALVREKMQKRLAESELIVISGKNQEGTEPCSSRQSPDKKETPD